MRHIAKNILVQLASGIGNIALATPLLIALDEMGFNVDVLLHADYPETAQLLLDWSIVRNVYTERTRMRTADQYDAYIPAIPPFYWHRCGIQGRNERHCIERPPDSLFYQNEQEYYLTFARKLGYPGDRKPFYRLPVGSAPSSDVTGKTLVLAPGSKTGEMAAKRWPYFPELAEQFSDVVLVGTLDDLRRFDGSLFSFPGHVRTFIGKLTLRQTAELIAGAGIVVGNDSGLSHVAAAVGTPTIMLFGPTPHKTLGQLPPNVTVLRTGLSCEPCWFSGRFRVCAACIDCLRQLDREAVTNAIYAVAMRVAARGADDEQRRKESSMKAAFDPQGG